MAGGEEYLENPARSMLFTCCSRPLTRRRSLFVLISNPNKVSCFSALSHGT